MSEVPEDNNLETPARTQVQKHSGLKAQVSHYERSPVGHPEENYDFLLTIARRYIEAK